MSLKIKELEFYALEWQLFSLDVEDKRDLFGQSPTQNPLAVAMELMRTLSESRGWARQVWVRGRPVASLGVYEVHPGLWSFWGLGADNPEAMLLAPALFYEAVDHVREHGGRRIECRSIASASRAEIHRQLEMLGFERECVLSGYGTDGSAYIQFSQLLLGPVEQPSVRDATIGAIKGGVLTI